MLGIQYDCIRLAYCFAQYRGLVVEQLIELLDFLVQSSNTSRCVDTIVSTNGNIVGNIAMKIVNNTNFLIDYLWYIR